MKTQSGTDLGTYTSDEDGLITTAFLSEDKVYTLTETKSPKGYQALPTSMSISIDQNGTVTVGGVSEADYQLNSAIPGDFHIATLIVKDKPYHFRAVKIDGDTEAPLAGATFALHRQVTVGDVTTFDLDPMPGYDELVTDEHGNIPEINDLPAGVYELRETTPPRGYQRLPMFGLRSAIPGSSA